MYYQVMHQAKAYGPIFLILNNNLQIIISEFKPQRETEVLRCWFFLYSHLQISSFQCRKKLKLVKLGLIIKKNMAVGLFPFYRRNVRDKISLITTRRTLTETKDVPCFWGEWLNGVGCCTQKSKGSYVKPHWVIILA